MLASSDFNVLIEKAAYLQRTTAADSAVIDHLRVAAADLKSKRAELDRLEARQTTGSSA